MAEDTPRPERAKTDQGIDGRTSRDPTLASYLSSLLYVFAVPALVVLAYAGYWTGIYPYSAIIPAFGGLLVVLIVLTFGIAHVATSGR